MVRPKFVKKAGAFLAAAALSAMLAPGLAMADEPVNSTTGPDNVVVVNWTEGNETHTCNVDLDQLTQYTNKMGALYKKSTNPYTVLGTNQYVTLASVISQATEGNYSASHVWDNDSDYIVFDVWNEYEDEESGETYYQVDTYSKYNNGQHASGFTRAKLNGCDNFYGGTYDTTLVSDSVAEYASGAILALNGKAQNLVSGTTTTAETVLSGMSGFTTATSPRLMWGNETGNTAGNRFPSNIDVITIYNVA